MNRAPRAHVTAIALAGVLAMIAPAALRAQTAGQVGGQTGARPGAPAIVPANAPAPAVPAAGTACPAANIDIGPLPRSIEAIAKSGELTIVAFGSSSTAGWMSSDAGHSYPAVMQEALAQALPHAHVAVVNRGIGGQDAAEELLRIDSDVTNLRPSLVIWQVGANGAMRRTDPELFRRLVASGLERLRRPRTDVVLMDNQRSPLILASPEHDRIDNTLANLARDAHVGLFSRSVLMDKWREEGAPYENFVSSDGLHHNDRGYRCLGLAVAQSILARLNPAQAPVMVSNALPPEPPRAPPAPLSPAPPAASATTEGR